MANQTIIATATDLTTGEPAQRKELLAAGIRVVDDIDAAYGVYAIEMPQQVVELLMLGGELSLAVGDFHLDAEML